MTNMTLKFITKIHSRPLAKTKMVNFKLFQKYLRLKLQFRSEFMSWSNLWTINLSKLIVGPKIQMCHKLMWYSKVVYHIYIFKGCISAEELQFVMNHLPGKVREIKILIFILKPIVWIFTINKLWKVMNVLHLRIHKWKLQKIHVVMIIVEKKLNDCSASRMQVVQIQ